MWKFLFGVKIKYLRLHDLARVSSEQGMLIPPQIYRLSRDSSSVIEVSESGSGLAADILPTLLC